MREEPYLRDAGLQAGDVDDGAVQFFHFDGILVNGHFQLGHFFLEHALIGETSG